MNELSERDRKAALIGAYKTILQDILNRRPSGTRQRLATALGKNRSFVSQISNSAYVVPIPAPHLDKIFEVCHFSPAEKASFLDAYARAHPERLKQARGGPNLRILRIEVVDFGDVKKNQRFDELVRDVARKLSLIVRNDDGAATGKRS